MGGGGGLGGLVKGALGSTIGGAILGPVGAIMGGIAGGAGAGPQYADTDALQGIASRQMQGADLAYQNLNNVQPQQNDFAKQLAANALGQGPSIAQAQLKSAMDRNLQQQIGAAHANRAINPALASRQINNQAAQAQQQTANAGATARMQEQQQQQAAFGNYLSQQQAAGAGYLNGAGQTQGNVLNAQMQNQARGDSLFGSLLNTGAGIATKFAGMNKGGMVQRYAKGGLIKKPKKMYSGGWTTPDFAMGPGAKVSSEYKGLNSKDVLSGMNKKKDKVTELPINDDRLSANSPEELSTLGMGQSDLIDVNPAKRDATQNLMSSLMESKGGQIPGQAEVEGDSEKNDKVHALLSPGEIVIPRTIVADGHKAAGEFVRKVLQKEQRNSGGGRVFGDSNELAEYADGGEVKAEKPWYSGIFEEDKSDKKTPVKSPSETNPKAAKAIADYFNSDKYNKGGQVKQSDDETYLQGDPREAHGKYHSGDQREQPDNTESYDPAQEENKIKEKNTSDKYKQKYADGGEVAPQLERSTKIPFEDYLRQNYSKNAGSGATKKDTDEGQKMDSNAGFGGVLAAHAELSKRLDSIEKRFGKGGR